MKKRLLLAKNKKALLCSILMFNIMTCSASLTMAWFLNTSVTPVSGEGSINKSYFEGGDGSIDHPFQIKYPIQFYYFSWLQDMGYFNHEDSTNTGNYQQYHFELIDDINMKDYTLPPAGSIQYPFVGSFEGNGYSISNITISNSTDAYTDEPLNIAGDERNYQIMGVFGVVGSYGSMPYSFNSSLNYIQNLTINNVTVNSATPKNNQTLMGIVAGYVNDNLSDNIDTINNVLVGGSSTITSAGTTALGPTTHLSDYTLIGYTNNPTNKCVQNVEVDEPNFVTSDTSGSSSAIIVDENGAGGDLVVAPCGLKDDKGNTLYDHFGSNLSSGRREVDGATVLPDSNPEMKSAYYTASISASTPSPTPSMYKIYNGGSPAFSGSKTTVGVNTNNSDDISDDYSDNEGFTAFMNYKSSSAYRVDSSIKGLYMSSAPSFTGVTSATALPTNCIWFKPMNTGHCFISFGVENMSKSAYMSIYRYKRNANGAYTGLQELVLEFTKANHLTNGTVVLFDLIISDIDYEYCIGKSTTSGNSAYFYFLKLAGTDSQGGTGIPESVTASEYAVYEQSTTTLNNMGGLDGVRFIGDPTAVFQLNTMQQSYQFTSTSGEATVNDSPGGAHVSTPSLSQVGYPYLVQTITGYDVDGNFTLMMMKITTNNVATYYYQTSNDPAPISTNESVIGRYFEDSTAFSSTLLLEYHHEIADPAAPIYPTGIGTWEESGGVVSLTSYTVSTTISAEDVSISYVGSPSGYSLIFTAGGDQIYPAS